MDVITAVENHSRGNGGEKAGPKRGAPAEAIGDERQQQDHSQAKGDGDEPELGFGEMFEIRRGGQAGDGQGSVKKRRAVIFFGVVSVGTALPEPSELKGVDRFVIVHWTLVQPWTTQRQGHEAGQQQTQSKAVAHPRARTLIDRGLRGWRG